jgi:transcriptional regulator with XRE-family HTH domain
MARVNKNVEGATGTVGGSGADKPAFVERLKTILAHWPSADRLARAMGVSPSAFRKWLKGEAEPSRERLVALARAAGVGVAWLAEGEGPPPSFDSQEGGRRRSGGWFDHTSQPIRYRVDGVAPRLDPFSLRNRTE